MTGRRTALAVLLTGLTSSGSVLAAPGDLDPTFGGTGIVRTSARLDSMLYPATAFAVALFDDGRIIAIGDNEVDFVLMRLLPDGTLDTTFGAEGRVVTDVAGWFDTARALVVQPDGKLVVAGSASDGSATHVAIVRYQADGSIDNTFGSGGTVRTTIGTTDAAFAMDRQSDGKLVVAGHAVIGGAPRMVIARYLPDGNLDPAFDGDGVVVSAVGGATASARAVVIQPDGKIVVAGQASDGVDGDFALVRYLADGSLDTTFGGDGSVMTPMSTGDDIANALVLQPDGRLLAVGTALDPTSGPSTDVAVARYLADGSLDTAFGNGGTVTVAFGGWGDGAFAARLQSDGKLVVGGSASVDYYTAPDFTLFRFTAGGDLDPSFGAGGMGTISLGIHIDEAHAVAIAADDTIIAGGVDQNSDGGLLALTRWTANGSLDPSFGSGGAVSVAIGSSDYEFAQAVAVQPDGRLVTAGYAADGAQVDIALTRHLPDGTLDTSFGGDGRVVTDIGLGYSIATALVLQPDGKLVVAGAPGFTVLRYNNDGSLDPSFGGDGVATVPLAGEPAAVALQPDGRIVVVGYVSTPPYGWTDFALVRLNADGTLDTSFGGGGVVTMNIGVADDYARAVVVQPDGKLVVAGETTETWGWLFTLARYNSDGSLDASFDGDGIVTTGPAQGRGALALALQPDGKLVAAGATTASYTFNGFDFMVARYHPDGSLDATFDGDGVMSTPIGSGSRNDFATALLVQPDGKLLTLGLSRSVDSESFAIVRLNPDGSLDPTFDGDGKLTTPSGWAGALAGTLQSDGKLVAAGYMATGLEQDFVLVRYELGYVWNGCPTVAQRCRSAAKSVLDVRDGATEVRDKLVWRWWRGQASSQGEFADPTADTLYSWCLYDGAGSLVPGGSVRVPATAAQWSAVGDRGYRYRDPAGSADGVYRMLLLGSEEDRAKVLVNGKGAALPDPSLPLPVPLMVQLFNERNGLCWEAVFREDEVRKNEPGRFRARVP